MVVVRMLLLLLLHLWCIACCFDFSTTSSSSSRKELILDTDVDMEDVLALLYLLKQNSSIINVKAITINANSWVNPGFGINMVYDVLYMMGRDDIPVGIGGEGGIASNGTIFPDVGGYLPIVDQAMSTRGACRYRQAIPPGSKGGSIDIDTNYGLRRKFLPQGTRHYIPGKQPTAQQVMLRALSSGSNTVLLLGSHTNFALLLMTYPHLRNNIEHVYIMGGGKTGNLFTGMESNPRAEFNIFADPFASYQVFHSGLAITLVPLDATNTVPVTDAFISALKSNASSLEADYAYQTLNMVKQLWPDDFSKDFYMWDTFTSSIAVSGMLKEHSPSENDFATMYTTNLTVVTSNRPYGVHDGSNPLFETQKWHKFKLSARGVHSGHVQTGLHDPFCFVPNGTGTCMDGSTVEVDTHGVKVQVASSSLDKHFYTSFIEMMNSPHQTARFNLETQFPYFRELEAKPNTTRGSFTKGKPLIFDMDMSPGDILTLIYLLKVPTDVVDLKLVTVAANGWANAAAIDIVYDVLHMMGRDDIPVGLGAYFALNQSYPPFNKTGNCNYRQAIPNGAGGLLDSDTLYGLARELPRSPRRYTVGKPASFGALRTLTAQDEFLNVFNSLDDGSKVTILTGGPLTNVASFLSSASGYKSLIKEVFTLGGSIHHQKNMKLGNLFTIEGNTKAELNMFLDPEAANVVLGSELTITLASLDATRQVSSDGILSQLEHHKKPTPESVLVHKLLGTIERLKSTGGAYEFTLDPLSEVVAAVLLVNPSQLRASIREASISVVRSGRNAGWTKVSRNQGRPIRYVRKINTEALNALVVNALLNPHQAAVVPSFSFQKEQWSRPAAPS